MMLADGFQTVMHGMSEAVDDDVTAEAGMKPFVQRIDAELALQRLLSGIFGRQSMKTTVSDTTTAHSDAPTNGTCSDCLGLQ